VDQPLTIGAMHQAMRVRMAQNLPFIYRGVMSEQIARRGEGRGRFEGWRLVRKCAGQR